MEARLRHLPPPTVFLGALRRDFSVLRANCIEIGSIVRKWGAQQRVCETENPSKGRKIPEPFTGRKCRTLTQTQFRRGTVGSTDGCLFDDGFPSVIPG